jgi:putative nucleotidyltransferase with HDIG domain
MPFHIEVSGEELAQAYRWLAVSSQRLMPVRLASARGGTRRRQEIEAVLGELVAAFERAEPCVRGHSERVAALSQQLAVRVGLSPDEAEIIGQAGLLHDIGQAGLVSGDAGSDCSTLSGRHAIIGAHLVAPFDFLALAAPMIRHHHERLDGSGHPDGVRGLAIPVGARIIAVADEYDRLTEGAASIGRPRGPARELLAREAGRTLDSTVVSALLELSLP